jgi:hypothetical protein
MGHRLAADFVVIMHLVFAGFVVFGFFSMVVGPHFGWTWTSRKRFRITHLTCIFFVALEGLLGVACPLTLLENQLLNAAGEGGYHRSFIGRLAHQFLFYDAPEWVFTLTYVALAMVSILAYFVPLPIHKTPPHQERLLK